MKFLGFLLLLSGWGIVVAAALLLRAGAVQLFIVIGIAVEILGLVLFARAHLPVSEERG